MGSKLLGILKRQHKFTSTDNNIIVIFKNLVNEVVTMTWFIDALRSHPELTLFLTLAIGYAVGKIQIGTFKIGSVTGVLVTGVIIGQLNITIDATVKSVFFLLFLFALGYNAGPQFFKGLKKDGIPQVIFSVIVCVIGLISTIIVGKILHYNAGQAAGLAAGALTQSAVIGVAQDSISQLSVSAADIKSMSDFVPVGYAVTYIFGTIGCAFVLSTLGPKIYGVDLAEESRKIDNASKDALEGKLLNSRAGDVDYRAYIIDDRYIGQTVKAVEHKLATEGIRLFMVRMKRGNDVFRPNEDEIIQKNDRVAFSFKERDVSKINLLEIGQEISDYTLINFPTETVAVYVKDSEITGKSISEVRHNTLTRGVFISKLQSTGDEIPYNNETVIKKKDVITLTGPVDDVEALAYKIGKPARDSDETDMIFVGLGILIGGLIGIPALTIGHVGISLSTSGGALIMGLIFGLIHSRRPTIGRIPKGTAWFLSNVGLAAFVAVVGINAGPGFVSGLRSSGISFFLAGVVVTLIPTFAGIFLGKYVFKFSAPIALGATAGALTTTAAIGAITEKAESNAPVLGYTVPYAVGNILLTVWGSLVIIFFS